MGPTRPRVEDWAGALVTMAPPSALRHALDASLRSIATTAFASGWMRVRGRRRWRGFDRGFVMSDHADWPGLLDTIRGTGARRVFATHGYSDTLARYLCELGLDAEPLPTRFEGEADAGTEDD